MAMATAEKSWILDDLERSGITPETAASAGIADAEIKDFPAVLGMKTYLSHNLARTINGYKIPYRVVSGENGTEYCRVKLQYGIEGAKYLAPRSGHTRFNSHLYIIPSQEANLPSPKKPLIIVEGEKKTLSVIQQLPKDKFCVVGIAGVRQWKKCPEWEGLNIRISGRDIYICLDADGVSNPDVRAEEIKLYCWLINQGANAKSLSWDPAAGKGIDDFLVAGGDLPGLLDSGISTLEKFKDRPSNEIVNIISNLHMSLVTAELLAVELKRFFGMTKTSATRILSAGKFKTSPPWAKNWFFVTYDNVFFNTETKEKISERAFNLAMNKHCAGTPSSKLASSGCLPTVHKMLYLPGANETFTTLDGQKCVNTFKMWDAGSGKINQENIDIIMAHAQKRFPREWRVLIDFLAWCVQNPGKKLAWVLFIQGVQGSGKTFWAQLMTVVMGDDNVKEIDPITVQSDFNGWAEGACFGVIDEIRISGHNRFEIMDRTKVCFTNSRIPIHRKGRDPYDAPNVTNYLLVTNHKNALPLNEDDRRYGILFSSCQSPKDLEKDDYFPRLFNTLNDRDSIVQWLSDWKVSDTFSQYSAPNIQESREEMLEVNKSDLRLIIEDFMEDHPNKRAEISTQDVQLAFTEGERYTRTAIAKELMRMGYSLKIKRVGGKVVRLYFPN